MAALSSISFAFAVVAQAGYEDLAWSHSIFSPTLCGSHESFRGYARIFCVVVEGSDFPVKFCRSEFKNADHRFPQGTTHPVGAGSRVKWQSKMSLCSRWLMSGDETQS